MSLLQLLNKKLYYLVLLTILLYVSTDISSHNYIALGKEDDSDDENVREKETDYDDDYRDNDIREDKEEEEDEKEGDDEVPFILPFKAVPFP